MPSHIPEDAVSQHAIIEYIRTTFADVETVTASEGIAEGDTFFMYAREQDPKMPFATLVTKDYGDFDAASQLNRPDVFRLNIGVGHQTLRELFASLSDTFEYAALDRLLPHPVYAAQGWVCVLNPSAGTFETLKPMLRQAYERAVERSRRRAGA